MPENFGSPGIVQPLSVGNVVSTAIRLYRSHFKQYLTLAFQGTLWAIIPIYGWAKAYTIYAMISRLAFSELVNQPEEITTTHSQVNSRLWTFLWAQILVGLILFGTNLCKLILQLMVVGIFTFVLAQQSLLVTLISQVVNLLGFVVYIWIYSRIFLPELPIAVEENIDASRAISRSWELTKDYVWRLQAIIIVASLITIPLLVIAGSPFIFAVISLVSSIAINPTATPSEEILRSFFIFIFIGIIFFLLASIIVSPFWQSIKAVVYYDLRSRREGLGLQLRNHDI